MSLYKIAASRMDKVVLQKLTNGDFEGALDIYRKHNIVRQATSYHGNDELNSMLHFSPLLNLSKKEQMEYANKVKHLDRQATREANTILEAKANQKSGTDNKSRYKKYNFNPLKDWGKYEKPADAPGKNYIYTHHGGYHTLDLAINRQNKAVQKVMGTPTGSQRLFYTVTHEDGPHRNSFIDAARNTEHPNDYSVSTAARYGDVPGASILYAGDKKYHNAVGRYNETPIKGKSLIDDVKNGNVKHSLVRHHYYDIGYHNTNRVGVTQLVDSPVANPYATKKDFKGEDLGYVKHIKELRNQYQ